MLVVYSECRYELGKKKGPLIEQGNRKSRDINRTEDLEKRNQHLPSLSFYVACPLHLALDAETYHPFKRK